MRYWRDIIAGRAGADRRILAMVPTLELWLERELAAGTGWDKMAKAMLSAGGSIKVAEPATDDGANFFLLAHNGDDQTEERAAETARVFLGMQIGCAQCHDHPFDAWKREQFHELAAYFAKIRPRPLREEQRVVGIDMTPGGGGPGGGRFGGGGEYRMPDKNSTARGSGTVVHPKFLDGKSAGRGLEDKN